jgi:sigma-E factor negative regulatory protein RseA
MKATISAMMDGELDEGAFTQTVDALSRDGEAFEAWRTYHLISDAMRDSPVLSPDFSARLTERLVSEATVLAPARFPPKERRAWFALSAAASIAAVGLVGWMAFGPQQAAPLAVPVAQTPQAVQPTAVAASRVAAPVMVPPPVSANDYLLAHQGFSPRLSLQGMVPYVRTVSEPAPGARK